MICSILLMYAFIMFTRKDYKNKRYKIFALYQLFFGLWLAVFFAWFDNGPNDSSSGIIGYILHHFLSSTISGFIYILLPITLVIIIRGMFNFSIYDFLNILKRSISFYAAPLEHPLSVAYFVLCSAGSNQGIVLVTTPTLSDFSVSIIILPQA